MGDEERAVIRERGWRRVEVVRAREVIRERKGVECEGEKDG